jgi:DNA (cytosine-5)-methyltransferase 1
MSWDEPSPTITTNYFNYGSGRFGHPEQTRALSLREGAILQSFPDDYEFIATKEPVHFKRIATHIGNAVPVRIGKIIGQSIVHHLEGCANA